MPIFFGYGMDDIVVSHISRSSAEALRVMTEDPEKEAWDTTENLVNKTYKCLGHAVSDEVGIYFISFCGFSFLEFLKFLSTIP